MIKIHPLSDVQSNSIGNGTIVWQFSVILPSAVIGKNCNINALTLIENDVIIGDNVTIKSGVQVWDGLRIEDNAFVGPNVTFTNDFLPRSKVKPEFFRKTHVKRSASIGANATIIGGVEIGCFAMIGSGSVVTRNVPNHCLVYGNPAKKHGFVCECGQKLKELRCIACGLEFYKDSRGVVSRLKGGNTL